MYSFRLLGLTKRALLIVGALMIIIMVGCQNKSSKEEGWVNLFDGNTLDGWKVINQDWNKPDSKPDFYIEDNIIVCNTRLNTGGGYLVTEKSYTNFILELDVKIDTSLNSGIQCRSRQWERDTITKIFSGVPAERKWRAGYVWGYQIEVDPSNRAWSGGLYEPGNRGWLVTLENNKIAQEAFKPMDWNHFKIVMDSNKIQTWVNSVPIVDTTDDMSFSGFIGIQFHGANKEWQKNKKSMWKNIRIKEL
ncbi:MAG: DUF1080 domain-containing protein [Prolixibacteraceae bacterium]|nr:DUF1080 domain-containing protein [Prolixibacteraceae bacterium]